jgi:prolyl-tRNA editing enzyme YbaK/EbsC (Cys-tRNA(Pro) deacylase)
VSQALSPAAVRVQQALAEKGIPARIVELPASTHTSAEAAHAIGCSVEQIAKSVVFRRVDTGGAVLVLLRGVDRVDTRALAAEVGSTVERATPDFVRDATGFAIGGVPPLAHDTPVEVFVDDGLLAFDVVWAAAGTPNAVFSADPRRLVELGALRRVAAAASPPPRNG